MVNHDLMINHGRVSHELGKPCEGCEEMMADNPYVQSLIKKHEAKVVRAFGNCTKCYGKGYSTYRHGISGTEDFGGEGFKTPMKTHIIYCSCDRGKQLEQLMKEE